MASVPHFEHLVPTNLTRHIGVSLYFPDFHFLRECSVQYSQGALPDFVLLISTRKRAFFSTYKSPCKRQAHRDQDDISSHISSRISFLGFRKTYV